MAQVVGGTTYDFEWDRKHDAALREVRRVADQVVSGTPNVLNKLLPAILHIFGERFFWDKHSAGHWARVAQDFSAELLRLKPQLDSAEIVEVTQHLQAEVDLAAEQWALGDPEKPPTADLLNALEHLLFRHRIIKNPPKHRTPTSLQT